MNTRIIESSLFSDEILILDSIGPKEEYHREGTCLRHTMMVMDYLRMFRASQEAIMAAAWHDTGMILGANGHAMLSSRIFKMHFQNNRSEGYLEPSEVFYISRLIELHSIFYWVKDINKFNVLVSEFKIVKGSDFYNDLIILTIADQLACWCTNWQDQIKRIQFLSEQITLGKATLNYLISYYQLHCDPDLIDNSYIENLKVIKTDVSKDLEKQSIKDRYDYYYRNCMEWSVDEIDTRLRIDFMHPTYLSDEETIQYIDQLCYGSTDLGDLKDLHEEIKNS